MKQEFKDGKYLINLKDNVSEIISNDKQIVFEHGKDYLIVIKKKKCFIIYNNLEKYRITPYQNLLENFELKLI